MRKSKMDAVDIDPNFEPQTRARSNTWPCRPVEDFSGEPQHGSPASDDPGISDHTKDVLGIKQKTSSRRNAWGNLSYADLITKAIQSSPEQRLTLSQIYDWMVQNVPYFKDKGDNTSSAGWKVRACFRGYKFHSISVMFPIDIIFDLYAVFNLPL